MTTEVDRLRSELAAATAEVERLRAENRRWREHSGALVGDIESQRRQLAAATERAVAAERDLAALRVAVAVSDQNIESLTVEVERELWPDRDPAGPKGLSRNLVATLLCAVSRRASHLAGVSGTRVDAPRVPVVGDVVEVYDEKAKQWDSAEVIGLEPPDGIDVRLLTGPCKRTEVYWRSCAEDDFAWRWPEAAGTRVDGKGSDDRG